MATCLSLFLKTAAANLTRKDASSGVPLDWGFFMWVTRKEDGGRVVQVGDFLLSLYQAELRQLKPKLTTGFEPMTYSSGVTNLLRPTKADEEIDGRELRLGIVRCGDELRPLPTSQR